MDTQRYPGDVTQRSPVSPKQTPNETPNQWRISERAPLFWVKKKKPQTEEKPAEQAKQKRNPPPLAQSPGPLLLTLLNKGTPNENPNLNAPKKLKMI